MNSVGQLVAQALERTNAHALARLVTEKRLYTRVLWLIAWLICCGFFIRQLVGFIIRLQANDVTTNLRVDEVPFQYPDLYFCFDNPMSGSRHLEVSPEFAALVNWTLQSAKATTESWCSQLPEEYCDAIKLDSAELRLNSLPYNRLVNELGHIKEQSIIVATLARTNGLDYYQMLLEGKPFYHPKYLRCFKISLNVTQREVMRIAGPDDVLYIMAMMDAPDLRMGRPILPVVSNEFGNFTAPYWALDRVSLSSKVRSSTIRVYITSPGHYPTDFDESMVLESGRSYSIQLEMEEQVHREDPNRCVESHPSVNIVNPFDNSAYPVVYNYGYCYLSAMQAQFRRVLNASLGYLPQPWPPSDRLLFNLSSRWGQSTEDIKNYLEKKSELKIEEPFERCVNLRPCTEQIYTATVRSTLWLVESIIDDLEGLLIYSQNRSDCTMTALKYLEKIFATKNYSQELADYLRANMLQMQIAVEKSRSNRIIFTRAYSLESFVADLGGILGIYLGMSVLTACEIVQFLHDLVIFCLGKSKVEEKKKQKESKEMEIVSTFDSLSAFSSS